MVEDVVQRAIIWKAVQEFLNLLLGLHSAPPAAAGASQRRRTITVPRNERLGSARVAERPRSSLRRS
jgi:hypothetical protein